MLIERSEKFAANMEQILVYIAQDSKIKAHSFADDLQSVITNIHPNLYKYRKSIYFDDERIRDCIFKGYIVPYKIYDSKIVLLGITKYRKNL